jgi:hypothetical protein
MKDLLFELQVKNYEKVHKNLSELDSDAMTDELWFGRGIAALGLSAVDRDRTKEAKMCIGKIESDVIEELFVELDIAINDFAKNIHNGSINAYNKDMMRDKPDNVNYGLQMISGNIAKTGFLLSLTEAYKNICHIYEMVHPFIAENDAVSKDYKKTINYLNNSGFKKTDIYKEVGENIEDLYGLNSKNKHQRNYDADKESSKPHNTIIFFLVIGFILYILITQMIPDLTK